jgi:hypothetical protein
MGRLADNALFEAYLCDRRHVTRADVERAWADLDPTAAASGLPPEPRREAARRERAPRGEPKPLHPLALGDGSLGDLDSELEAIFESDEEDASPARSRRERASGEVGLVAQLVEE